VDLRPLDALLRMRGVQIAYPHIDDEHVMTFRFVLPEELVDDPLGFAARPSAREATEST